MQSEHKIQILVRIETEIRLKKLGFVQLSEIRNRLKLLKMKGDLL